MPELGYTYVFSNSRRHVIASVINIYQVLSAQSMSEIDFMFIQAVDDLK